MASANFFPSIPFLRIRNAEKKRISNDCLHLTLGATTMEKYSLQSGNLWKLEDHRCSLFLNNKIISYQISNTLEFQCSASKTENSKRTLNKQFCPLIWQKKSECAWKKRWTLWQEWVNWLYPFPRLPLARQFLQSNYLCTFFNDQSNTANTTTLPNIHGHSLWENVIAAWLCLCNSITSFQYTHSYTAFMMIKPSCFSRASHWTLVLRLRFDGKKLPSIFFRLYLHCLLSVIDVLCIIHYAVIVHILSPIHSAHSFAAKLSEARKKLCKFRWKLSRIFILVHFSLDAHWKVHIQRKIIPSKTRRCFPLLSL